MNEIIVVGIGGSSQVLISRYLLNLINATAESIWHCVIIDQEDLLDPIKEFKNFINKVIVSNKIKVPSIEQVKLHIDYVKDVSEDFLKLYFDDKCLKSLNYIDQGLFGYPCLGDFLISNSKIQEDLWDHISNFLQRVGGTKSINVVVTASIVGGTGSGLVNWMIQKLKENHYENISTILFKRWFAPNPEKYKLEISDYDSNEELVEMGFEYFKYNIKRNVKTDGLGDQHRTRIDSKEVKNFDPIYRDELIKDFERVIHEVEEIAKSRKTERDEKFFLPAKEEVKGRWQTLENKAKEWSMLLDYLKNKEPYRVINLFVKKTEFTEKVREFLKNLPKTSDEKGSLKKIENKIKESLDELKKFYLPTEKKIAYKGAQEYLDRLSDFDVKDLKGGKEIKEAVYTLWYYLIYKEMEKTKGGY